jgi:hypothetical protein
LTTRVANQIKIDVREQGFVGKLFQKMEDPFVLGLVVMDAIWLNIAEEEWMELTILNKMTFMISAHFPLCATTYKLYHWTVQ